MTALLIGLYVAAMTSANLSVAHFGPWVSPLNSFFLIGLDLTLRDKLHDRWDGSLWKMALLILGSAGLSYAINPASGLIAIASFVAFAASAAVDWVVYGKLKGKAYMTRVNGSNSAGAAVDSILFPTIAFGVFMPLIVAGQFAAKVGGGYVWSLVFRK